MFVFIRFFLFSFLIFFLILNGIIFKWILVQHDQLQIWLIDNHKQLSHLFRFVLLWIVIGKERQREDLAKNPNFINYCSNQNNNNNNDLKAVTHSKVFD